VNVVWVILAGWWLAIAPVSLMPLGKEIVSTRQGAFDVVTK